MNSPAFDPKICPIWGTPAYAVVGSDSISVESPRAGGLYSITLSNALSNSIDDDVKPRLTTWIVNQRRMGVVSPLVDAKAVKAAQQAAPLRTSEKVSRFFLALLEAGFEEGGGFKLSGQVDDEYRRWHCLFGAWTEAKGRPGGLSILSILEDLGLVRAIGGGGTYRLTAAGYDRMEQLTAGRIQFDQGFVAMWFASDMADAYDQGLAPGIEDAGYRPMRIDRKEHNNKIDDEIIAEIRRSRFLVADMTCPVAEDPSGETFAIPRGGVYYEAGFAQGLGIPVIWSAREDTVGYLHFDTRQYSHILWKDAADLREKLRVRIGAVLGYRTAHAQ